MPEYKHPFSEGYMNEEKTKNLIVMSIFVAAGAMVSISTPDLDQIRRILWRANIIGFKSYTGNVDYKI